MHWACIKGRTKIVDLLLDREARLKARFLKSVRDMQETTQSSAAIVNAGEGSAQQEQAQQNEISEVDAPADNIDRHESKQDAHVVARDNPAPPQDRMPSVHHADYVNEDDMLPDPASSDDDDDDGLAGVRQYRMRVTGEQVSQNKTDQKERCASERCV